MKGCVIGVIVLVVLVILVATILEIAGCTGQSELDECLEEAYITTEVRRLGGWFISQYEEDTFRRQLEVGCRILYGD